MATTFLIKPHPPRAELKLLLEAAGLPADDLDTVKPEHFFGLWHGADLVGGVGLEPFDQAGLLRSLVVADAVRQQRLGARLLNCIETHAREMGVTTLYLLTTDAESYFSKAGYHTVPRSMAPAAIRDTRQFAGLCPGSATFMYKKLD